LRTPCLAHRYVNFKRVRGCKETRFFHVCAAISNILIARFMLDLRGLSQSSGDDDPSVVSSIKFLGNLGAPLEVNGSTWTTNASDEPAEDYIKPDDDSRNQVDDGVFILAEDASRGLLPFSSQ